MNNFNFLFDLELKDDNLNRIDFPSNFMNSSLNKDKDGLFYIIIKANVQIDLFTIRYC